MFQASAPAWPSGKGARQGFFTMQSARYPQPPRLPVRRSAQAVAPVSAAHAMTAPSQSLAGLPSKPAPMSRLPYAAATTAYREALGAVKGANDADR